MQENKPGKAIKEYRPELSCLQIWKLTAKDRDCWKSLICCSLFAGWSGRALLKIASLDTAEFAAKATHYRQGIFLHGGLFLTGSLMAIAIARSYYKLHKQKQE